MSFHKLLINCLLLFYISHHAAAQQLYILKLSDSIPIHFDFATNQINNLEDINNRLEKFQQIKDGKIIINAYTDTVGTIEYNTELAEKRLQTAVDFVRKYADETISVFTYNRNENRDLHTLSINDTLFRRSDILVYENVLNIELNKPYPLKINFDGDSYILRPEAKPVIDEMIEILEKESDLSTELHGHISGHRSTYDLSLNRTLSVKQYMVERGINPDRIICKGMDNKHKLVHEEPWENNPLNRRVEIIFFRP